jgi:hypothetical protein
VAAIGIAGWWAMAPREPSYQGKMVSEWFGDIKADRIGDDAEPAVGASFYGTGHQQLHYQYHSTWSSDAETNPHRRRANQYAETSPPTKCYPKTTTTTSK